jgi:hypothetical protein
MKVCLVVDRAILVAYMYQVNFTQPCSGARVVTCTITSYRMHLSGELLLEVTHSYSAYICVIAIALCYCTVHSISKCVVSLAAPMQMVLNALMKTHLPAS